MVFAAYLLLARFGLRTALEGSTASPLWPATGLAIAAAVWWGPRIWPAIAGAALVVETTTTGSLPLGAAIATGNTLEALAGALLVGRLAGGPDAFATPRNAFRYLGMAGLVAPLASATVGAVALVAAGRIDAAAAPAVWATWYLGDAAGAIIVGPALLLAPGLWALRARAVEAAAIVAAVAATGALLFLGPLGGPIAVLTVLCVPPLMWSAFRLGPAGTAWALLVLHAIAVAATALERGPFLAPSPTASYLTLQLFLGTLTLLILPLAAVVAERRRAAEDLEGLVANRTAELRAEVEERRRAEAAAQGSLSMLAATLESTQDAITVIDAGGRMVGWNSRFTQMWGFPPGMLERGGRDELRAFAAARTAEPEGMRRVFEVPDATGPGETMDVVRLRDGRVFERYTRPQAVGERIVGRVVSYRDVTARDRAQAALAASHAALAEAQRIARVGSLAIDPATRTVTASAEMFRLLGVPPEDGPVPYEAMQRFLDPAEVAAALADLERAVATRGAVARDMQVRPPTGEARLLHFEGILDPASGRLVGTAQDVTEARRREAALRESLERFKVLADASPLGIFHTTTQGQVDYANPRWTEIAGCDPHDSAAIRAAVHPEDVGRLTQAWRAAVASGTDLVAEFRYVHRDGKTVQCATRASPVRDGGGQVTGFVGTVDDVSERHALEARQREMEVLREQARFKTEFLRTAAHELGNPLTPVKLQLRLLKEFVAQPEHAAARHGVEILNRNVERLHLLVSDMLESARLQAGRMRLAPRPMDLSHTVHEVAESFQEAAIQGGIALDVHVPPRLRLVADPDRLTQVLDNLVSNAMKFTRKGGRIRIEVEPADGVARVTVQDDGAGFTPDQAAGMFQPFGQVHDAVPGKGGTGLGLYISKGIVEQHGGSLDAHSDGPGKGALFTVRLPLVAPPAQQVLPEPAA
ncbi:MAG TPA: MASE1 domain-containing protein [Candidatus Thermoplasmatota archaeon]|nr:MASE1 domain-containing protein [Candidatus Thermoplasmatota archaeon]